MPECGLFIFANRGHDNEQMQQMSNNKLRPQLPSSLFYPLNPRCLAAIAGSTAICFILNRFPLGNQIRFWFLSVAVSARRGAARATC
jgi:hypothetical protein